MKQLVKTFYEDYDGEMDAEIAGFLKANPTLNISLISSGSVVASGYKQKFTTLVFIDNETVNESKSHKRIVVKTFYEDYDGEMADGINEYLNGRGLIISMISSGSIVTPEYQQKFTTVIFEGKPLRKV